MLYGFFFQTENITTENITGRF